MNKDQIQQIKNNAAFRELVDKKTSLGWILSIIMLATYVAFILIIGFAPSIFAHPLFVGSATTVGIPVGLFLILVTFILTGIYIRRANNEFDALIEKVTKKIV